MQRLHPTPDLLNQILHVSGILVDFFYVLQFEARYVRKFLGLHLMSPVLAPWKHRTELN